VDDIALVDPPKIQLDLTIHKSKANKTGPPELLYIQQYKAPSNLCTIPYLRHYLSSVASVIGHEPLALAPASTSLFPSNWLGPKTALTKRVFIDVFCGFLTRANIPATHYSSRSGGTSSMSNAGPSPFNANDAAAPLLGAFTFETGQMPSGRKSPRRSREQTPT